MDLVPKEVCENTYVHASNEGSHANDYIVDITSPILKNILRVFLTTLPSTSNDTGMDIPTIRRKLLLGDYKKQGQFSGFESFIQDLDLALPHSSSKAAFSPQAHAAEILVRIFS